MATYTEPKTLKDKAGVYISQIGAKAREHDSFIKFLSTNVANYIPSDSDKFFGIAKARINNPRTLLNFKNNFTRPNCATSLIDEIWTSIGKLWTAKDRFLAYNNIKSKTTAAAPNFWDWWKAEGWDMYKYTPNSCAIIQPVDSEQGYSITAIHVESILLIVEGKDGIIEFAYKSGKKIYYMHDGVISVYNDKYQQVDEDTDGYWDGDILPVVRVSSRKFEYDSSIYTNILGNLYPEISDYLYESTLSKINTNYAHANIAERVRTTEACGYKYAGKTCEGGYLKSEQNGNYILNSETLQPEPCPVCNKDLQIGGVIDIPINKYLGNSEAVQPTQSIRFVAPDVSAMEFSSKRLESLRKRIFSTATGRDVASDMTKAFNSEMSIVLAVEGQDAVLMSVRNDLENGVVSSAQMVGDILFGNGQYELTVNIGTQFLLHTTSSLLATKKIANELGLSEAMDLDTRLVEMTHGGNNSAKKRAMVIITLNKLLGNEITRKLVAEYELKYGAIAGKVGSYQSIAMDILAKRSELNQFTNTETNGQGNTN